MPFRAAALRSAMIVSLRPPFVASFLRGALPPVDLRAVCLVRAMIIIVVLVNVVVLTSLSIEVVPCRDRW